MAKAGARHSKADAEHMQAAHDHLAKMGAVCDKANCGDDGEAEKAAQLVSENERLTKALADAAPKVEDLVKGVNSTIETLKGEIETLEKRLVEVENTPAAPKAAAGPLRAVSKVEDVNPAATEATPALTAEDFTKALNELPEHERGELLLRVALRQPHLIANR